jgi:hypothetical protein
MAVVCGENPLGIDRYHIMLVSCVVCMMHVHELLYIQPYLQASAGFQLTINIIDMKLQQRFMLEVDSCILSFDK